MLFSAWLPLSRCNYALVQHLRMYKRCVYAWSEANDSYSRHVQVRIYCATDSSMTFNGDETARGRGVSPSVVVLEFSKTKSAAITTK